MQERIRVEVVDNFPALGRVAAMRFLKWVQNHPEGVISLPTGKTPEHFITWVRRSLDHWTQPDVQALVGEAGLDVDRRPDVRGLRFVQIDEFYPINPTQHNSFCHYVRTFYLEGFGLDPARALLIDCSVLALLPGQTLESVWPDSRVDLTLRNRAPVSAQETIQQETIHRIDQWCQEYEAAIRGWGGIGFFLGGIGPDGHIGFNVRGSDHFSTTRLTPTNYETQAAAATDLGGIEVSRNRLVITIGLGTLTYNPDCTALIIAAGESKARVVADAIQQAPDVRYPATALHVLPNAAFVLTSGAASLLTGRRVSRLETVRSLAPEDAERILVDVAVSRGRRLLDLTPEIVAADPLGVVLLRRSPVPLDVLCAQTHAAFEERIRMGTKRLTGARFLHTEPHHDDLMLGLLPLIVRYGRQPANTHHFVTLTSGFTAVTNVYLADGLRHLDRMVENPSFRAMDDGYFDPGNLSGRNRDLWQYLDGVAARDPLVREEGTARRLLRNLLEVYGVTSLDAVRPKIREILRDQGSAYPGRKDPPEIQRLKGMSREWEAECLWGYFGWNCASVSHLRLGFYTGDIFTEEPTRDRDVPPILSLLRAFRPTAVSVAFDPEASGPDTHYKVMQAIRAALEQYADALPDRPDIQVLGYRNVWYRFHPSEANVYVPVSLNMFTIMENAFLNTFISQRNASFPSHEYDGPFCGLAQRIQVEQYQTIKTCLGRGWFHEHNEPLIRATRGFVFLKQMTLDGFAQHSRDLQRAAEAR